MRDTEQINMYELCFTVPQKVWFSKVIIHSKFFLYSDRFPIISPPFMFFQPFLSCSSGLVVQLNKKYVLLLCVEKKTIVIFNFRFEETQIQSFWYLSNSNSETLNRTRCIYTFNNTEFNLALPSFSYVCTLSQSKWTNLT